jgi:hypothetical protein
MLATPEERGSRRLHHELEHAIRAINRDVIGGATGAISRDAFTDVARMVARLRGRYLASVLTLGTRCVGGSIDTETALELKRLREAYAEALEGFAALEHALQRGYISLSG